MFYRIAILDDDADALRRTEEMLSAYSAAHPAYELETVCFKQRRNMRWMNNVHG